METISSITDFPVKNDYNAMIGLRYFDHKDRIAKTKLLEREMTEKKKLNKGNFRISSKDDCVFCEFWDKSIYY